MREENALPGGSGAWFEGWYLKHWGEEGGIALIPAVHRERRGAWSASLQVITPEDSRVIGYPISDYQRWPGPFQLRLGRSWFGEDGVYLDVEGEGISLRGELHYGPLDRLDRDIMGPFHHVPHMQCVHGILSMGHQVDGVIQLNGRTMQFIGDQGYLETDRGRSFPRRYLWTQCGWRDRQRADLMLAVAKIPMPVGSFTGCICQIGYGGRQFRLATYHGASVERWGLDGAVVSQGRLRLEVDVLEQEGRPLRAPEGGKMDRVIHESLFAVLRYRFWVDGTLLFDHTDRAGSFEYSDLGRPAKSR